MNETTWEIVIKDNVCFSNGKKVDAAAVKACFEHLVEVHERAADNLKIASMEADGQKLTIVTSEPNPILMNYLSEAYGCIIDMEVGIPEDGCVVGTGPYVATEVVTDDHVHPGQERQLLGRRGPYRRDHRPHYLRRRYSGPGAPIRRDQRRLRHGVCQLSYL